MGKFCKNCGAKITEEDTFCQDCGKQLKIAAQTTLKYCPDCGNRIYTDSRFCPHCGRAVAIQNGPIHHPVAVQKESFFEKHKTPIMIIAIIAAIAIVGIAAFMTLSPGTPQDVEVDTITFTIPGGFTRDPSQSGSETEDGVYTCYEHYTNGGDFIELDVMYPSTGSDAELAEKVARELGGTPATMCGQTGYYNELSDAYSFAFVKDGKLCTIYVSNSNLFEEITC